MVHIGIQSTSDYHHRKRLIANFIEEDDVALTLIILIPIPT